MSSPPTTAGLVPAGDVGARVWFGRQLLSVLRPLMGTPAHGYATVRAIGADVVLPGGSYAVPIIASSSTPPVNEVDFRRPVKTTSATVDDQGEWEAPDITVTSAGTEVPILSMLGGVGQNLPAGTLLKWDPFVAGVEPISTITTAMTGGAALAFLGGLKSLCSFNLLGVTKATIPLDAWKARIGEFPAGVLGWVGTARGDRPAANQRMRPHKFRFYVLSSTLAGADDRYGEALATLDYAEALLEQRQGVDGTVFAAPSVGVVGSGMVTSEDASYVYVLDIEVPNTFERIDTRTFRAWLHTQSKLLSAATAAYPDLAQALVLANTTTPQ